MNITIDMSTLIISTSIFVGLIVIIIGALLLLFNSTKKNKKDVKMLECSINSTIDSINDTSENNYELIKGNLLLFTELQKTCNTNFDLIKSIKTRLNNLADTVSDNQNDISKMNVKTVKDTNIVQKDIQFIEKKDTKKDTKISRMKTKEIELFKYILLNANKKDTYQKVLRIRNNKLVKRGELFTTSRKIANKTDGVHGSVHYLLENLVKLGKIELKTYKYGTHIKIIDFENELNKLNDTPSKDTKKDTKNIIPPTLDMVKEFVYEQSLKDTSWRNFETGRFFDYNEKRNWILKNRKKIKDWKLTARTWKRNSEKWNDNLNI